MRAMYAETRPRDMIKIKSARKGESAEQWDVEPANFGLEVFGQRRKRLPLFAFFPQTAGGFGVIEEGADTITSLAHDVHAQVDQVALNFPTQRRAEKSAFSGEAGAGFF